jgi:phosphoglycerate dehydrogenase-like enzyme
MKVLLPPMNEAQLRQLQEVAPGVTLVMAGNPAEVLAQVADADGFYGGVTPEIVRAGKRLRWVQVASAGVEEFLFPELVESRIVFTNAQTIYGPQLADHAMAFILSFSRNLPILARRQQQEVWESRAHLRAMELSEETLLIVGFGGSGQELAKRAHGFGMRLLAVDPKDLPRPDLLAHLGRPEELLDLLPQADHVALCCAHTPATHHLFSTREFERMKPTACLHNVARGGLIDQEALIQALEDGEIAGAGLDVTDPEPLPPGHPLWKMENVILTPHTAGHSPCAGPRMFELLRENLRRFAAGEELLNVVDKRAGY